MFTRFTITGAALKAPDILLGRGCAVTEDDLMCDECPLFVVWCCRFLLVTEQKKGIHNTNIMSESGEVDDYVSGYG